MVVAKQKSLFDRLLVWILVRHRWIFVVFLLPLSVVYNMLFYLRNWIVFKLNSAPHRHDEKVANVQRQVREWRLNGAKTQMCTARPSWANTSLRFSRYKKTMTNIDVNLSDVLQVDTTKKTVRTEPLVTMGQISATLIPLGWTLPVVPELDDLTVGGLISGIGIETSSHIYGLFKDICVSLDVVTADGQLLHCSEKENSDLFYAVPFSHGTLGFLVAAEMMIVPAKKYVRMEYEPTYSLKEMAQSFSEASHNQQIDFVEALVFSENDSVVMKGYLSDTAEWGRVNHLSFWWKPWFYVYVSGFLKTGNEMAWNIVMGIEKIQEGCKGRGGRASSQVLSWSRVQETETPLESAKTGTTGLRKHTEYIPLRDYYHRHTRSLFWMIRDIIPFGNHWLFRLLLGWASPPKVQLLKATMTQTMSQMYEETNMLQDMLLPMKNVEEAVAYVNSKMNMFPLWLCPHMAFDRPGLVRPAARDELYVDIGTYGVVGTPNFDPVESTRAYETFVRRLHGHQMLYADSYQTREEFGQMFDRSLYDTMRQKLPDCTKAFPDVYDKTNRKARD